MPRGVPFPDEVRAAAESLFTLGIPPAQVVRQLKPKWPDVNISTVVLWHKKHRERPAPALPPQPAGGVSAFSSTPRQSLSSIIYERVAQAAASVDWSPVPAAAPRYIAEPSLLIAWLEGVALGLADEVAAGAAGVRAAELEEWVRSGSKGEHPAAELLYLIDRARCIGARELHAAVVDGETAGTTRAKWASWLLERRRPDEYKPRRELSVDRELDQLGGLSSEELARLLAEEEGKA